MIGFITSVEDMFYAMHGVCLFFMMHAFVGVRVFIVVGISTRHQELEHDSRGVSIGANTAITEPPAC